MFHGSINNKLYKHKKFPCSTSNYHVIWTQTSGIFFLGAKWNNAFQSSSQPFNGSWKHRLVEALIHNTMHVVFFWGYTYWFWWTLIFSKYSIVISLQPSSKHLANPLSHYGIHHSITLQGDLAANATKPVLAFPCRCKLNQKWKLDSSCHLAH